MSFRLIFSGDLLRARESRGWTQQFVADLVSITLRQYQNIERGSCIPHTDTFLKLVYVFDLDIQSYREAFPILLPTC